MIDCSFLSFFSTLFDILFSSFEPVFLLKIDSLPWSFDTIFRVVLMFSSLAFLFFFHALSVCLDFECAMALNIAQSSIFFIQCRVVSSFVVIESYTHESHSHLQRYPSILSYHQPLSSRDMTATTLPIRTFSPKSRASMMQLMTSR